jgi:ABC-type transporter Mla subunit MlaD
MLKKIGRILVLVIAVLVIVLSVGGIFGAWSINSVVSNFTLKVISVVQGGVKVVDTAAGRVDTLVQTARSEVQQASEMVTTIAGNLQENRPVLTALNERLETRLGPAVDKVQETLAPVHDVLVSVSNAVSFANSLTFVQERAPRLEQLDQTLTQLTGLAADVKQLRTTLNAAVTEKADQLTQGVATALTDLAARIDGKLAGIQSEVQALQAELAALQGRVQTLQSVLLLIFNLIALLATLLYIWVIYSQVVVIQRHWVRSNSTALNPVTPEPITPTTPAMANAPLPVKIDEESTAQPADVTPPDQPETSN